MTTKEMEHEKYVQIAPSVDMIGAPSTHPPEDPRSFPVMPEIRKHFGTEFVNNGRKCLESESKEDREVEDCTKDWSARGQTDNRPK